MVSSCSSALRYDDPSANSALAGFRRRKRLKKLENAAKADTHKETAAVALGMSIPAIVRKEGTQESDHHTNGFDQAVLEDPAEGL